MTRIRTLPARIRSRIRAWRDDERGSASIELMLMIPLWLWFMFAAYVFYDGYRTQSINAKAGYTIGDIVSRQQSWITPEFIDSMHALQALLIETNAPNRLRVSTFRYIEAEDEMELCWSEVRGGGEPITQGDLDGFTNSIPIMADGDVAILVQSRVDYVPVYAAGLDRMQFDDFVITRPRVGQARFNTQNEGGDESTAVYCREPTQTTGGN